MSGGPRQGAATCKDGPFRSRNCSPIRSTLENLNFSGVVGEIGCGRIAEDDRNLTVTVGGCYVESCHRARQPSTLRHRRLRLRFLTPVRSSVLRVKRTRKPQQPSPPSSASCGGLLCDLPSSGKGESV